MDFPERFTNLPDYAFPRLRALLDVHAPGGPVTHMSIGEPRHAMPPMVGPVLAGALEGFGRYPANDGTPALLEAISAWIARRYGVTLGTDRLMVLNGTREGLFNAGLALFPEKKNGLRPVVLIPNPFYQVYAVAALAAGAEPVFVPATPETGHLPDFAALPEEILSRTIAAYLCSPANPQGSVAGRDYLAGLLALAEKHDFRILADECYSELWRDAPPPGILQVAAETGADPERALAFHSLSKRSNLPGLRSGFVAGGPRSIAAIRRLRAYAGAPLPEPLQAVAAAVWADEDHVDENRALYRRKYEVADETLGNLPGYRSPEAGFFLWLPVPPGIGSESGDGEAATLKLWRETGIRVLPGAYLARTVDGANPGTNHIRVALVAPEDQTRDALTRLRACIYP